MRRDGKAWVIEADYEDAAPLFANLSLLVTFDKTVSRRRRVTEACFGRDEHAPNGPGALAARQAGI